MDLPGFRLSQYGRISYRLRPLIDHDLVGNLMCVVEEGGRVASARAKHRLFLHLEDARLERDRGLPGDIRRMVRKFEALFVDDDKEAGDWCAAPSCFELHPSLTVDHGSIPDSELDVTASRVPR